MYGCESWTIKKAKRWSTNAFELWCLWRLLRVPWTARRFNLGKFLRGVLILEISLTHTHTHTHTMLRLEHFVIPESNFSEGKGVYWKDTEVNLKIAPISKTNNLSSKNTMVILNCNIKKTRYSYVQTNVSKWSNGGEGTVFVCERFPINEFRRNKGNRKTLEHHSDNYYEPKALTILETKEKQDMFQKEYIFVVSKHISQWMLFTKN